MASANNPYSPIQSAARSSHFQIPYGKIPDIRFSRRWGEQTNNPDYGPGWDNSHLTGGQIAGIVVGSVAAFCILAGIVWWWTTFTGSVKKESETCVDKKIVVSRRRSCDFSDCSSLYLDNRKRERAIIHEDDIVSRPLKCRSSCVREKRDRCRRSRSRSRSRRAPSYSRPLPGYEYRYKDGRTVIVERDVIDTVERPRSVVYCSGPCCRRYSRY